MLFRSILVTVGLALVVQELVIILWGPLGGNVAPPEELSGVMILGDFVYPEYRLFVIGFTAILAACLWWLLDRTRLGAIVRAGSESPSNMALLGYDTLRINTAVFALGAGLAGLAGALAAGLLVGIAQSLMATLWPEGARLVIYLGMAGIIMAMPRGLFGRA